MKRSSKKRRTTKFNKGFAPINISIKKYKLLIEKRQDNPGSLTDRENYELDFALNRKYCNCVEKVKYKSRKLKKSKSRRGSRSNKGNNPYAICTSSVFIKRGFRIPKTARKKCGKLYAKSYVKPYVKKSHKKKK